MRRAILSYVEFAGAVPFMWSIEDVGYDCGANDGFDDLLFFFKTQELDLDSESIDVELTGETQEGIPFVGIDEVRIVPSH